MLGQIHPLKLVGVEFAAASPAAPQFRAVYAEPAILTRDLSAEEAFHRTLRQCQSHIAQNIRPVVEARDVDGLHQLRVSLRRARMAFAAFGPAFRGPAIENLRLRAKLIARRLAPARDLDVFLEDLFEPVAAANRSSDAFAVLRARAQVARRAAWNDAVHEAGGASFASFLHDFEHALNRCLWRDTPRRLHPGVVPPFVVPVGDVACNVLNRRLRHVRRRAHHLDDLTTEGRHALRIAMKKLRYTAEFFAPLYPGRSVQKFLKRMSTMQDVLGAMNDVAAARTILDQLVDDDNGDTNIARADLAGAAGLIYGWHLHQASLNWQTARKKWKVLNHTAPFWAKA